MSYILDALKKSDKQRQQESVPDLNTVQEEFPPPKEKKVSWPLPLTVIVLLNLLFGLFFVFRPDNPDPVSESQAVAHNDDPSHSATAQSKHNDTVSLDVPRAASTQNEISPATPAIVVDAHEDVSDQNEQAVLQDSSNEQGSAEPNEEDVFAKGDHDDLIEQSSAPAPLQQDYEVESVQEVEAPQKQSADYSDKLVAGQLQTASLALPAQSSASFQQESLVKKALHIYQLPDSVRQQLPDIHIDAHLFYKDKPNARFASINGKVMREGDLLDQNLKVAEISPEGVVFSYQKYFFYVSVF